MEQFIANKKIKYSVDSYKPLYHIDEIKKALYTSNSSYPLVTELLWM